MHHGFPKLVTKSSLYWRTLHYINQIAMIQYDATLIISVYDDAKALKCILGNLRTDDYLIEVIISEDGNNADMAMYVNGEMKNNPNIVHLTQDDIGFRKNMALNRAIISARSNLLIFIDGDCILHRDFIKRHIENSSNNHICVGRRVELGVFFSKIIRRKSSFISILENKLLYILLLPFLYFDNTNKPEAGFNSRLLQRFNTKIIGILGSNFSCHRNALMNINGFNEAFNEPGIGEDSDIEWRLRQSGNRTKNIKFLATQYHLYHEIRYSTSTKNMAIMRETQNDNTVYCKKGIDTHIEKQIK